MFDGESVTFDKTFVDKQIHLKSYLRVEDSNECLGIFRESVKHLIALL